MLIIDGAKYRLWTPKNEEREFHPMIKEHSKEIFGENSLFLPVEEKLVSKAGKAVMPDGFAIIFSKIPEMYVVEVELSKHDLDKHIVEQINGFVRAIKNPENQKKIADRLDKEVKSDLMREAFVKQKIGISKEIYKFLSDLVSQPPKIVIIIEHKDKKVVEACENLKISPIVLPFKTFVREDAQNIHAHLFKPLCEEEEVTHARYDESRKGFFCSMGDEEHSSILYNAVEIVKHLRDEHYINPEDQIIDGWKPKFQRLWEQYERREKETKRPHPLLSWEKKLVWVDDSTKEIVKALTNRILQLGEVTFEPHGEDSCFYKGTPSTKSIFAAFMLRKKALKVGIRTDPKTFKDPKKWTGDKIYKGWFFKQGQERAFKISDKKQIDYAMKLIKQSYEISGETKRNRKLIDIYK